MVRWFLFSLMFAVASACAAAAREKVLFDTDIGGDPDDGLALQYLLKEPRCELLGITTCCGRPELAARIASALCQSLGRDDVPVHAGCSLPIHRGEKLTPKDPSVRNGGWFEALKSWPHDEIPNDRSAVEFLRRTIRANPGEVTLFASAGFSNLATLFTLDPEIPSLLKRLIVVGGNFDGTNYEWNAYVDVFATAAVFEGGFRMPPKALVLHGAEVTTPYSLPPDEGRAFLRLAPSFAFVRGHYAEQWFARPINLFFHDPIAAVAIFHPEIMTYAPSAVRVDVADRAKTSRTEPTGVSTWIWQMATAVDFERFREVFLKTVSAPTLTVSLTFDDAHKSHLTEVAPLLEERGFRGLFCVPSDWVGRKNKMDWDDLRELKRRGHEVVPHGASHSNLVTLLRRGEAERVRVDLRRAREAFSRELGEVPRLFCLPFNACDDRLAEMIRAEGMEPVTTLRPVASVAAVDRAVRLGWRHVDLMTHDEDVSSVVADFASRQAYVKVLPYGEAHPAGSRCTSPMRGVLCLTFDDSNYDSWRAALPVFARHGARATFYAMRELDGCQIGELRHLRSCGQTIGLHTVFHGNVPTETNETALAAWADREVFPQVRRAQAEKLSLYTLAYPNNRRSPAMDAYLVRRFGFTHFRAGAKVRYAFEGDVNAGNVQRFETVDDAFMPVEWCLWKRVMNGIGLGPVYCYSRENVFGALRRAADRNEVVTFFSHAISPGEPDWIGSKTQWIEDMLTEADRLGLAVLGFDDLGRQ